MLSLRNGISRGAHKERAQPDSRKRFGLLEKHKDYVIRAKAFHKNEETLQKLREKAEFRNPDEFYFKMIKTIVRDGVHQLESQANKFTQEELMLMKTQDISYILQKLQSEKKKIEKLTATLHSLDTLSASKHSYYAEDRVEAYKINLQALEAEKLAALNNMPPLIQRKTASSYKELQARKRRVQDMEKIYMDMTSQKELWKKGRKRKLREDEIVSPTANPVYRWPQERKR